MEDRGGEGWSRSRAFSHDGGDGLRGIKNIEIEDKHTGPSGLGDLEVLECRYVVRRSGRI